MQLQKSCARSQWLVKFELLRIVEQIIGSDPHFSNGGNRQATTLR